MSEIEQAGEANKANIERIIETLELVNQHKPIYLGWITVSAAVNFLFGFGLACRTLGIEMPPDVRETVQRKRGWRRKAAYGVWVVMQERGLSVEAIVDELFAIELDAWRKVAKQSGKSRRVVQPITESYP